ncbi:hypothetical protein [Terriglobus albidus]|uniref:hypothetical protein n=1 Tax=Terriglobus albidus TaxID=1592106 RepID=UPI0021DF928C|nr:hypothetical protein [Terriglobus albidus]
MSRLYFFVIVGISGAAGRTSSLEAIEPIDQLPALDCQIAVIGHHFVERNSIPRQKGAEIATRGIVVLRPMGTATKIRASRKSAEGAPYTSLGQRPR